MADAPKTPERKPLTKAELDEFLVWLYNHTGYAGNVDLWRDRNKKPAAAPAAAANEE